jgi:hypothetical protein
MNYKKLLIAFALLSLYSLSCEAQYIQKATRGDTVSIDTAVVMDITTYRTLRNLGVSTDKLIESKVSIIKVYEQMVSKKDSVMMEQVRLIAALRDANIRKDETNRMLAADLVRVRDITAQGFEDINKALAKKDRTTFGKVIAFITKPEFLAGVGIGILTGAALK